MFPNAPATVGFMSYIDPRVLCNSSLMIATKLGRQLLSQIRKIDNAENFILELETIESISELIATKADFLQQR